ncbi:MAG: hypothetical protein HYV97_18560 [Bdellovibrio sp.]|nr:hypothetical protein [Bdellovibrio sp.]
MRHNVQVLAKFLLMALILVIQSCASYQYAQQIKMISFDKNFTQGASVGPIQGEDCVWSVFGFQFGDAPTIERAFMSTRDHGNGQQLRYINNVISGLDSFNAGVVSEQCITVTGIGFL